jgi:hypothetical protein
MDSKQADGPGSNQVSSPAQYASPKHDSASAGSDAKKAADGVAAAALNLPIPVYSLKPEAKGVVPPISDYALAPLPPVAADANTRPRSRKIVTDPDARLSNIYVGRLPIHVREPELRYAKLARKCFCFD